MVISFETTKLRTICESSEEADAEFGQEIANRLRTRLADLAAAPSVGELPHGLPAAIRLNGMEAWALRVSEALRIAFVVNHAKHQGGVVGRIEWEKVRRVKLIDISDGACDE